MIRGSGKDSCGLWSWFGGGWVVTCSGWHVQGRKEQQAWLLDQLLLYKVINTETYLTSPKWGFFFLGFFFAAPLAQHDKGYWHDKVWHTYRTLWIEFEVKRTYKINLRWASPKCICYLHLPWGCFSSVFETGSQTQGLPALAWDYRHVPSSLS